MSIILFNFFHYWRIERINLDNWQCSRFSLAGFRIVFAFAYMENVLFPEERDKECKKKKGPSLKTEVMIPEYRRPLYLLKACKKNTIITAAVYHFITALFQYILLLNCSSAFYYCTVIVHWTTALTESDNFIYFNLWV